MFTVLCCIASFKNGALSIPDGFIRRLSAVNVYRMRMLDNEQVLPRKVVLANLIYLGIKVMKNLEIHILGFSSKRSNKLDRFLYSNWEIHWPFEYRHSVYHLDMSLIWKWRFKVAREIQRITEVSAGFTKMTFEMNSKGS